ncbi:unnamed protein product [Adineta ricciae]|uniref:G-protein coupled receptors family 1 profile domain-containing protein n=1 Tax=Adineta ricciae TaxID=249248 RepID=A0A814J6S6_ADIRI|nr:unnamed protein product [Adineta ricciae]
MASIDHFHLDFFLNIHYANTSTLTNLTHDKQLSSTHEYNWSVLFLFIVGIFGTFGNLLVCVSITLDKQLQTVTNWFLFSLAIADFLVSLIVLPFSVIKDFHARDKLSSAFDKQEETLSPN